MQLSYEILKDISEKYGDTFYLLDSQLFEKNYRDMLLCFRKNYSNTHIAYSYKTNYTPALCKIVEKNGGYAEIVSEMEMWLALKVGVKPHHIYYNEPYKKKEYVEKLMCMGGHINCDSTYEVEMIEDIAKRNPQKNFSVGIRCNLDIGQEGVSRFGVGVDELSWMIQKFNSMSNVHVTGLHSHLPYRSLESFKKRMVAVDKLVQKFSDYSWEYISLGGGYMGHIDEKMMNEFIFMPPTYKQYADVVAVTMNEIFQKHKRKPELIIEPGTALVADTMMYVTRIVDIKKVKNKYIAITTGSSFGVNPSVKGIRRPVEVYSLNENGKFYDELDMAGYTCIESDYLYKGYIGRLNRDDFVTFKNVGSYSIVMKPPFILPDVPVLGFEKEDEIYVYKKEQTIDGVFERFTI